MASSGFSWSGFFGRLAGALLLVYATYNPERFSFFHWIFRPKPGETGLSGLLHGFTPLKATKTESFLKGRALDADAIKQASEIAASESQPFDDIRGSADYKRDVVRVLTARALRQALERARGEA